MAGDVEKCFHMMTSSWGLHSATGRHGIVLVLVSWALLSTSRMIWGTIHAAYTNYDQCCVCRWLVHAQRLHPAMGRHGIVLALWVELYYLHGVWWIGGIIHAVYLEWVNTVPADVWCRNYIQPWADICITCAAYAEYGQCCACCWSGAQRHLTISRHGMEIIFCMPSLTMYLTNDLSFHLCCVGGLWSMINAVSADGLMLDCTQSWADAAWKSVFCTLSFAMYSVHDLNFHVRYVHELWPMLCLLWLGSKRHPTIARCSTTNVFACWAVLYTGCLIYACIRAACMRNDECCTCWWSGADRHSASSGRSMEIYILYTEHCHVHRLCFHMCYECGMWSMLCLLMVWCQPAFNHGQTRHEIYISYMQSIVMYVA